MPLTNISDKNLLQNIKLLVKKEQILITKIIDHLEEIEIRKLYCDLKHHSLYDYCVDELGYSKDQAYRRISAMKLTRKLPEAKKRLERGTISLSSANMLASIINETKMSGKEQLSLLRKIDGKSKRETNNIIQKVKDEKGVTPKKKRTTIKAELDERVRLTISISKKTMEKINRAKGLYGHQLKELDELLDMMADTLIQKHEENLLPKRVSTKSETKGRYISKKVKYTIYKRAQGRCKLCGSFYKLQYDHMAPHSRSGTNNESNIRLICANCNLRQGVIHFGAKKMRRRTPENSY